MQYADRRERASAIGSAAVGLGPCLSCAKLRDLPAVCMVAARATPAMDSLEGVQDSTRSTVISLARGRSGSPC